MDTPLGTPPAPVDAAESAAEWLQFDRCPGCQTVDRTPVLEWNRFVLREDQTDETAALYHYALCHGCGTVYATRRPIGARYAGLVDDFPDAVGRHPSATLGLLHAYPLTDEDRAHFRRLIAAGVFVSDHTPGEHLDGVFSDRLDNAAHVELLGSLLNLTGARVLEVRSRAGTILDGLRRHHGASVAAMPIFESQQFILRELYGIETSDLIDFDRFTIPFDGLFDLIVCNHLVTHIVRPERFFDEVRAHLRPGGSLYLYNETDESEFLATSKSILSGFNPLHLQAFDQASLIRLLKANGFETTFIKSRRGNQLCLSTFTANRGWDRQPSDELNRRVLAYANGRARMILRAPEHLRPRFAGAWEGAVAYAVATGIARLDDKGTLRVVKD